MTTFSASLTSFTALLPQSPDSSCYVNRPIPAPPPLGLQKQTDLRAHEFAHCPDLWHQLRLANVICAWRWRFCVINPDILTASAIWKYDSRITCDYSQSLFISLSIMFAKLWNAIFSFVISLLPHATTRLPVNGFLWKSILTDFSKNCRENSSFSKFWLE